MFLSFYPRLVHWFVDHIQVFRTCVFLVTRCVGRRLGCSKSSLDVLSGIKESSILVFVSGHRRVGSGSVTPKSAESPRTKGTSTPPGKEKHPVAKIASSLFRSPTKLERSMSLSRVAHRPVPEVEVACWRSPVAIGELILPGKRDKLSSFKEQELPLRQSWPRQVCTEQASQRDTGNNLLYIPRRRVKDRG